MRKTFLLCGVIGMALWSVRALAGYENTSSLSCISIAMEDTASAEKETRKELKEEIREEKKEMQDAFDEKAFLLSNKQKNKSPWIAGALSIVPGMGQLYNGKKHYWKVPTYLVGVGLLLLAVDFNNRKYEAFRDGYNIYKKYGWEKGEPMVDIDVQKFFTYRDSTNLARASDFYLSQRSFWIVLTAVGWAINVLDAVVYAHLSGFNIGKTSKLYIRPKFPRYQDLIAGASYGGISLTLHF